MAICAAKFVYEYVYKLHRTINFYKAQGITILPGAERPFIGNMPTFLKCFQVVQTSKEPIQDRILWVINEIYRKEGFRPEEHKAILKNIFGTPRL